jgi:hypothetical protein
MPEKIPVPEIFYQSIAHSPEKLVIIKLFKDLCCGKLTCTPNQNSLPRPAALGGCARAARRRR